MAIDLADAVLEQLRNSACAALFGDTWVEATQTGDQKFFGDYAYSPAEPYAVVQEPSEIREYMTPSAGNYRPFIADGTLTIAVYATARDQARELGIQVEFALTDARLSWPRCVNFMLLRPHGPASFLPTPNVGPDTPTVFVRMLTFDYQYQGAA
jgi:hypothetical protein